MPEPESRAPRSVYDHEPEHADEPDRGRRRRPVADWGVGRGRLRPHAAADASGARRRRAPRRVAAPRRDVAGRASRRSDCGRGRARRRRAPRAARSSDARARRPTHAPPEPSREPRRRSRGRRRAAERRPRRRASRAERRAPRRARRTRRDRPQRRPSRAPTRRPPGEPSRRRARRRARRPRPDRIAAWAFALGAPAHRDRRRCTRRRPASARSRPPASPRCAATPVRRATVGWHVGRRGA